MLNRNSTEKMFKTAEEFLRNNEYEEAKKIYLKCLALEPDNLNALNNLAQIYSILCEDIKEKGYSEILLKECDKQLECEANETVLMYKANALISLKRFDELNETLDEL